MDSFNFTNAKIRSLPLPEKGRVPYSDEGMPGLQLRVSATGNKSFSVFRRVTGSKPIRVTIGKFGSPWNVDDARAKAKQILSKLANSINPLEAKRKLKEELTVEKLFDSYEADRKKAGKRSVADMRAQYERYIGKMPDLPAKKHGRKREKPEGGVDWSKHKISEITPDAIEYLHSSIVQIGKGTTANRVHELIRAMFGYAVSKRLIKENPADYVTPAPEVERVRALDDDELNVFIAALDQEDQLWKDYFTLLLYIGYRSNAVASMQWKDLDLDAGIWRVRGEKAKNGEPIVLPVAGMALEVLLNRQIERVAGSLWVFAGDGAKGHITSPEKAWKRILQRSGITDFRPHDLRHTLASWMINNGVDSLPAIGRVLGHKDPRSTLRYAHLITRTATTAVSKAHDAMKSVIENAKVTTILRK
jgi:integrase